MENPYKPPTTELKETEEPRTKKGWGWQIYFYSITILSLFGMFEFLNSEGAGIVEYVQLIMLLVATAGFFGFIYYKQILNQRFWHPFLIVYFLMGLFYEAMTNIDMRAGMTDTEYYISTAIGYLLVMPAYYALFAYGKSSNKLWRPA